MTMIEVDGLHAIHRSERSLSGNWGQTVALGSYGQNTEEQNHRRELAWLGDTLYSISASQDANNSVIGYRSYDPIIGWSANALPVATGGTGTFNRVNRPTIASSRTGVYAYWAIGVGSSSWMRRRVMPINGAITEHMFWTGNNYIDDDAYIQPNYTVRVKTGSKTYILDNKKLVVESGGTLLIESGAEFYFGSGASLEIKGTFTGNGTSGTGNHVTFTRTGASGTWGGIVLENGGSGDIQYADFSYCSTALQISGEGTLSVANCSFSDVSTALSVGGSAEFAVTNCTIDNADIGVDIVSSDSDLPPLREISNCTISDIGTVAIAVDGYSNLLISGNTIEAQPTTGTGFKLLRSIAEST
jgi:hypothetical protein